MSLLTAADFPTFFRAVHRYEPFAWQSELARRVLEGDGWPEGIDVPTGMGKTAVIDVALFALAAQAGLDPATRIAPTRTFVIVDRRIIVDQTFRRANELRTALDEAPAESIVGRVGGALRSLSDGKALAVVRMRGGTTWGSQWLSRPTQPAVVVGTVDQFGSRLLFRGYGVSEFRRPIDAALCGSDSLLILDEAHLSQPLVETVRSVRDQERRAEQPVLARRCAGPVLLSATLPSGIAVHRMDIDAETSETALQRLDTRRVAKLVDVKTRKDPRADLAKALAAVVTHGLGRPNVKRLAVVCNTVRLARETFEVLNSTGADADVVLLVGRCRQAERDLIADTWLGRLDASSPPPARPIIAVATQTIEVGADLDFDWMVSEAAPLDALLQRLGRLNRRGSSAAADAGAIVVHAAARHDEDVVYGQATARTWAWLVEQAGVPDPTKVGGILESLERSPRLELGPRGLATLVTPDVRQGFSADTALAPVALGPVLDAWARTSPAPVPDQPVAPYLHGITRPTAEVQVCWRAGLPHPHLDPEAWEEELASAPPSALETVAVPIWEAQRFLQGGDDPGVLSDLEGAAEEEIDLDERDPVHAVILSPDGEVASVGYRPLRPGDTVVVLSEEGGHDKWGWTGRKGAAVRDVADLSLRRRERLRLRPAAMGIDSSGEDGRRLQRTLDGLTRRFGDDPTAVGALVGAEITSARDLMEGPHAEQLKAIASTLVERGFKTSTVHNSWLVAAGPYRGRQSDDGDESAYDDGVDDGDEATTSGSSRRVSLEQHLLDVGLGAQRFASALGLPASLVGATELAGRCHDLGKADSRFQAMLHGGSELEARAGEPLAKSGMDPADRNAYRLAQRSARWPAGMRHEAISGALVAALIVDNNDVFEGVDAELVCHLVQAHHGRARPLLPPLLDPEPQAVIAAVPDTDARPKAMSDSGIVDWDGPARFARLGRRYGWWGLALLEAIVRLADMEASASYERGSTCV